MLTSLHTIPRLIYYCVSLWVHSLLPFQVFFFLFFVGYTKIIALRFTQFVCVAQYQV